MELIPAALIASYDDNSSAVAVGAYCYLAVAPSEANRGEKLLALPRSRQKGTLLELLELEQSRTDGK